MEGEGRALWDRREGFLADRHIRCHRLILIILGVCAGQEMDLNCNPGDCELLDVGAGDSASSSVHSKPESALQPWFRFSNRTFVWKNE